MPCSQEAGPEADGCGGHEHQAAQVQGWVRAPAIACVHACCMSTGLYVHARMPSSATLLEVHSVPPTTLLLLSQGADAAAGLHAGGAPRAPANLPACAWGSKPAGGEGLRPGLWCTHAHQCVGAHRCGSPAQAPLTESGACSPCTPHLPLSLQNVASEAGSQRVLAGIKPRALSSLASAVSLHVAEELEEVGGRRRRPQPPAQPCPLPLLCTPCLALPSLPGTCSWAARQLAHPASHPKPGTHACPLLRPAGGPASCPPCAAPPAQLEA